MRIAMMGTWVAVMATVGCGSDDVRVRTYENEGSVCLLPEGGDASTQDGIAAGEPAVARVLIEDCGSYCAEIEEAECEATVEGETIRITSHGRTREVIEEGTDCPSACLVVAATCSVGSLEEGTYTLEHGDDSRTLEIPSTGGCDHHDL